MPPSYVRAGQREDEKAGKTEDPGEFFEVHCFLRYFSTHPVLPVPISFTYKHVFAAPSRRSAIESTTSASTASGGICINSTVKQGVSQIENHIILKCNL
jgi:hypothetical protein